MGAHVLTLYILISLWLQKHISDRKQKTVDDKYYKYHKYSTDDTDIRSNWISQNYTTE